MAVRHVKVGGTLASGNSTASDWTLANCYPTIATAIAAAGKAAGDELILEDETHIVTGQISTSLGIVGSYLIRARTARANNLTQPTCVISGSNAAGALFLFNDTTNRADIEFRDIGMTKSITHTDATRPVGIQTAQKTGHTTLTRIWFFNTSAAISGTTAWAYGFFNNAATPTLAATITLNGVTFSNISGTFGTGSIAMLLGSGNNSSTLSYKVTDLVYRSITATFGGTFNLATIESHNRITLRGFDVQDVILNGTYASAGAGALLYMTSRIVSAGVEEYGGMHIRNIKLKNVLVTTPLTNAAVVCYGPTDAKNILGINVVYDSTTHNTTAGVGCLLAVFGANMLKKNHIRKIRAYRCQSKFGTAIYVSNGAESVVDSVWAEECSTGNGIFYKGGNGDAGWSNLVAINNTWVDVIGEAAALVFHGHNGGSSGDTRHCKIGLRNLISKGNTCAPASAPISFSYSPGAYSLTVVAKDIVCRDEASNAYSIRVGTGLVNVTMDNANLAGAIDNAGTGTVTQSGTTDTDVIIIGGLSIDTELEDRFPVAYRVSA